MKIGKGKYLKYGDKGYTSTTSKVGGDTTLNQSTNGKITYTKTLANGYVGKTVIGSRTI